MTSEILCEEKSVKDNKIEKAIFAKPEKPVTPDLCVFLLIVSNAKELGGCAEFSL